GSRHGRRVDTSDSAGRRRFGRWKFQFADRNGERARGRDLGRRGASHQRRRAFGEFGLWGSSRSRRTDYDLRAKPGEWGAADQCCAMADAGAGFASSARPYAAADLLQQRKSNGGPGALFGAAEYSISALGSEWNGAVRAADPHD